MENYSTILENKKQTGIKIAGRNINNLRYADDTTIMAESEEELKSLLMKVKVESEKVHRRAHLQRPDPAAPVPAAGVSGQSRGASAVEAGAACLSARHSVFRASCVSGVSRPWVRCALWWESAVSACPPGCSRLR